MTKAIDSIPNPRAMAIAFSALILSVTVTAFMAYSPNLGMPVVALVVSVLFFAFLLRLSVGALTFIAVFMSAAAYRGVLYAAQLPIAGVVLNPLDGIWALVAIKLLLIPASKRKLPIAAVFLAVIALVTVASGVLWNQPTYNVAKLFRTEILLALGVVVGASLSQENRMATIRALVFGGVVTGLLQIGTFLFATQGVNIWSRLGVSAANSEEFRIIDSSATSSYRDNGVVIGFAAFALLVLLSSYAVGYPLFSRTFLIASSCTCVLGIVLSLTRVNWFVTVAALILLVLLTSGRSLRRASTLVAIMAFLTLLVVGLASLAGWGNLIPLIQDRLSSSLNSSDGDSIDDRFQETNAAMESLRSSWITGVGAADVGYVSESASGRSQFTISNQLHNGYVQVLLGGGILSLLLFLWVLFTSMIRALKRYSDALPGEEAFLPLSCFLILFATALTSITSGVVNDAQQSALIGVILGLALVPVMDRSQKGPA